MTKSVTIFAAALLATALLAGCSHTEQEQTREDARKLGQDIRHDAKKADAVVTQEMKDARVKVQEGAEKVKRELNK